MRELLDLATTKGVREFVRRGGEAGIIHSEARSASAAEREAFEVEAGRAWSVGSEVMAFIRSAGHFDVSIRPGPFDDTRVEPGRLEPLIAERVVRLRGWPVPFIDNQAPIQRYRTWVGQDIEARVVPHSEAWRMCASGQFLHRRVLATDLARSPELRADATGATGAVAVWDVLLYLVEVAELGARLGAALECKAVRIDVGLRGVAGRQLISGDRARELDGDYRVAADELAATASVDTPSLMRDASGTGVGLAQAILTQFGLRVPNQVLHAWQDETLSPRRPNSGSTT
ncbi:hypothetical protein ACQPXM_25170 [Kribbella sp. CA-253562]|uniref:hypothetical protein n=1 Tax=Kribbella sp. CA-253562 TaxID=3239942 RepID=UPI003D91946B